MSCVPAVRALGGWLAACGEHLSPCAADRLTEVPRRTPRAWGRICPGVWEGDNSELEDGFRAPCEQIVTAEALQVWEKVVAPAGRIS